MDILNRSYAMRLIDIYEKFNSTCIIDIDNLIISTESDYLSFNNIAILNNFLLTEIELSIDNLIREY